MSKSKAQGTLWERMVKVEIQGSLGVPVTRLAEEGYNDQGDLSFYLDEQQWIVECRDRQTMEVHSALAKARRKARGQLAFVVWKRKLRQPGNTMRTQVGPPVAIIDFQDLLALMRLAQRKGKI